MQDAEETIDHPTLNRTIPHGEMPQCKACGECFSNWDRILEELQEKTNETVGKATKVKVKQKHIHGKNLSNQAIKMSQMSK